MGTPISGHDVILIGGGLFLLAKATIEIHERLEGEEGHSSARVRPSFAAVITQIVMLDIVFSLDSVITAVGMADEITIVVTAVILAVGVMMFSAGPISSFVNHHPTVKVLALAQVGSLSINLQRRRIRPVHVLLDHRDPVIGQIPRQLELHARIINRNEPRQNESISSSMTISPSWSIDISKSCSCCHWSRIFLSLLLNSLVESLANDLRLPNVSVRGVGLPGCCQHGLWISGSGACTPRRCRSRSPRRRMPCRRGCRRRQRSHCCMASCHHCRQ
jgi:Integral membrane protein TerC family